MFNQFDESEEVQKLKAALTERNATISYLNRRNEEVTKMKRQTVAQKMMWRQLARDLWAWIQESDNTLDDLDQIPNIDHLRDSENP